MNDRRCIVTRQSRPAEELIRFVASPDGTIVPDLKERLPGRGAWVSADHASVASAVRKGAFARALKAPVKAGSDLADTVGSLLDERALGALGLAAKAGAVVSGMFAVERAARRGQLSLIISASDGAADGRRKLAAAVTASGTGAPRVVTLFTSEQLSLALGRSNVVHAGVAAGRAAASLEAAVRRCERYRDGGAGGARAAQGV